MSGFQTYKMKKRADFVAEIDPYELGTRINEAYTGLKRPEGTSAKQAVDCLFAPDREAVMRAATAAAEYLTECISAGQKVN